MDGNDTKAAGVDRRTSLRSSSRLSVESDGYDLDVMGISDGFRPPELPQSLPVPHPSTAPSPEPARASPTGTTRHRPLSTSKPQPQRESFSLQHDGAMGSVDNSVAVPTASTATLQALVPESPYQGPSGPSFPYQMYAQDVRLARTASVATVSTAAISDRSYTGPSGPTHPYQLYPQNTVVPEPEEDEVAPASIPVGFSGATDNYQRRIGTDGEEAADMIGPDGHTEQLPPYSRYPEEAYARKARGIEVPVAAPTAVAAASTSTAPVSANPPAATGMPGPSQAGLLPGAGGIGLATSDPEFSSTDDLNLDPASSHPSRQSSGSSQDDGSRANINTGAREAGKAPAEKPLTPPPMKKWQRIAKRKVWGVVPCWALGMTTVIVVMLAVVLGAILGTFLSPKNKKGVGRDGPLPSVTNDATPLKTLPADLPPLQTGTFAMPVMLSRNPGNCFKDTTQGQSWNCNLVFAQLRMTVQALPNGADTSKYSLSVDHDDSYTIAHNKYTYGMQPPRFKDVEMTLVTDVFEPSRGPAWSVELVYNKTVIIPEVLFPASSAKSNRRAGPAVRRRRGVFINKEGEFKRKGLAQVGDKPWICHWDGTVLETFIYANQNSSRNPVGFGGSTSSSATSPAAAATASNSRRRPSDLPGVWPVGERPGNLPTESPGTRPASSTSPPSPTSTDYFDSPQPTEYKDAFPRVVKMEERRVPGLQPTSPYCRQYEIQEDGLPAKPRLDSNGDYIEVVITEVESPYDGYNDFRPRRAERSVSNTRPRSAGGDMSDCGCMWWAN